MAACVESLGDDLAEGEPKRRGYSVANLSVAGVASAVLILTWGSWGGSGEVIVVRETLKPGRLANG
jgi:hypothetical protein